MLTKFLRGDFNLKDDPKDSVLENNDLKDVVEEDPYLTIAEITERVDATYWSLQSKMCISKFATTK